MNASIILTYLLSFVYYLLFVIYVVKQALRLEGGRGIAYLILIGAMINGVGIAFNELHFSNSLTLIGFLIFLLGFNTFLIQLLYKKRKVLKILINKVKLLV